MTRRTTALLGALGAVLLLSACTSGPAVSAPGSSAEVAQASAPGALAVSPDGTGDCGAGSPCTLTAALDKAGSGDVISLAAGDYGDIELTGHDGYADYADNVVVEASADAVASFGRLETSVPKVTWRGVRVTVAWFIKKPAVGTRVEASHLDGGGLFLRSTDVTVTDSLFEGGSSIDGIQIGGAKNALVENNTVRNYDQLRDNGLHADCVQIFDSANVTLRGNRLSNCYNAGIILSVGRGNGISDVTIESNFVQGCIVKTDACRGGSAADLREPTTTNLTVRNNTFLNGSVRVDPLPGLVFDRNIVGYASTCELPMSNSIVESWNTKTCAQPEFAGRDGNRTGVVDVVDRASGDLRPVDAATAAITPEGAEAPASTTIDGTPTNPAIAGAASPAA